MRDFIKPEAILPSLRATSKKQVFQELAKKAAELTGEAENEIFDTLLERERLGTTGIGDGVAIPHGKLETISSVFVLCARLEKPINFDSIDGAPVDLIFMLLAPTNAGADHLKALSRISRALRDKNFCLKLRGASDSDAIYALVSTDSGAAQKKKV